MTRRLATAGNVSVHLVRRTRPQIWRHHDLRTAAAGAVGACAGPVARETARVAAAEIRGNQSIRSEAGPYFGVTGFAWDCISVDSPATETSTANPQATTCRKSANTPVQVGRNRA